MVPEVAWDQSGTGPAFSDFPVAEMYNGPIAKPSLQSRSDEEFLKSVLRAEVGPPNFAGQYRIVRFRIGDGPVGAVLFDVRTGVVSGLPAGIVGAGHFLYDTDCLPWFRWGRRHAVVEEQDDSLPLSFLPKSELLIARRCIVARGSVVGFERSYYRWHGRKWRLLKRMSSPPPPPIPDYLLLPLRATAIAPEAGVSRASGSGAAPARSGRPAGLAATRPASPRRRSRWDE